MMVNAKEILKNPVHLLAFGLGSGLSPYAPGTMGTLVAIPLFVAMAQLPVIIYGLIVLVFIGVGIGLCGRTARDLKVPDHPGIVWDEITGYLITMFMLPAGWQEIIAGFLLFRLFDIWKPFPIRWLDRHVKGGTGIMLDDVLAGLFAFIILQAGYRLWGTVLPIG